VDRPSRDVHVHHLSLLTSNSAWEAAAGWVTTNSHDGGVLSEGDGVNSSSSLSLGSSASSPSSSPEDGQRAILSRQIGLAPAEAKGGVLAETPPFLLARVNEHGDIAHVPRPVHHAKPSRDHDDNDKRGRGARTKKKKGPEALSKDEGGEDIEDGKQISKVDSSTAVNVESSTARVGQEEVEDAQDSMTEDETIPPEISRELPPLPYFALDISCGGGTYVRSLIDDIAMHPKASLRAVLKFACKFSIYTKTYICLPGRVPNCSSIT